VAPTVSSVEKPPLTTTTLAPTTATTYAPALRQRNGDRPSLHRQIPTQVLVDGQAPTSAWRRRAGVRTRQSKNTNAALAACDVLDGPPVCTAQQPPVR
jgi:S-formylglutathione hydrolase FrmB